MLLKSHGRAGDFGLTNTRKCLTVQIALLDDNVGMTTSYVAFGGHFIDEV